LKNEGNFFHQTKSPNHSIPEKFPLKLHKVIDFDHNDFGYNDFVDEKS